MSRVGKKPISVPAGVTVTVKDGEITVKGPKGTLKNTLISDLTVKIENNEVIVERANEEIKTVAMHGTTRALINNMIVGVSTGFTKTLDLVGVGYRAAAKGKGLTLSLGFSHPIEIEEIPGISFKLDGQTKITVEGADRQVVGQVAANIRAKKPPEPYKGKGVKYSDEVIRRKEGKKA